MHADLLNLTNKFDTVIECVLGVVEGLDKLEKRIEALEGSSEQSSIKDIDNRLKIVESKQSVPSYASVTTSHPQNIVPTDNDRLDRVEFLTSEEERKKLLLEINLTHPEINNGDSNLENHLKHFCSSKMGMPNREIDANIKVFKTARQNSVNIKFSDVKYKKFIFITRKKLKSENPESWQDLFINEKLSKYNYEILKTLKNERKKRESDSSANFASVYSFEGKIYAKKLVNGERSAGIPISSRKSMNNFLSQLDSP